MQLSRSSTKYTRQCNSPDPLQNIPGNATLLILYKIYQAMQLSRSSTKYTRQCNSPAPLQNIPGNAKYTNCHPKISSLQSGGLQLMDSNTSTAERVSHHFNQEGFSSWTVTLPQLRGYLITSIRRASAHGQ